MPEPPDIADPVEPPPVVRSALVLTASDGVTYGMRTDESGAKLEERLRTLGFDVERMVVADDQEAIADALVAGVGRHPLVVTTGGTGFAP